MKRLRRSRTSRPMSGQANRKVMDGDNKVIPVQFSEALEQDLYAKHRKVYPREVSGRFANLRTLAVWVLLGVFYLLPWL